MKKAINWVKGLFGKNDDYYYDDEYGYDDDDYGDYEDVNNGYSAPAEQLPTTRITAVHQSARMRVERRSPKSIEEAKEICTLIKENVLIVVNLNVKEQGSAELNKRQTNTNQRIADYICGIVTALDGDMRTPDDTNNNLFLVGSHNVIFEWDDQASLKKTVNDDFMNFSARRASY